MAEEAKVECPACHGSGKEYDHDATGGYFTDCRDCHGSGQVPDRSAKAKVSKAKAAPAAAAN